MLPWDGPLIGSIVAGLNHSVWATKFTLGTGSSHYCGKASAISEQMTFALGMTALEWSTTDPVKIDLEALAAGCPQTVAGSGWVSAFRRKSILQSRFVQAGACCPPAGQAR